MLNKLKPKQGFLKKSEFTSNIIALMTGTTIAQAIPIAISPILTRIYTPEDFGIFALYIAIASFLSIVVAGRYEMAIVLAKDKTEAINILALSIAIVFVIVFLVTTLIYLFKNEILNILNAQKVGDLIYLIPVSIFLTGMYQIFNYWSNQKTNFKLISKAQIIQSITINFSQIIFGFFYIVGGLIFGNILGKLVSLSYFLKEFIKFDKTYLKAVKIDVILKQMKKHKDFPLVNTFHALSDMIRSSGSIVLISSFFGSSTLGFYSLSLRVLQVPIIVIGSALSQILYKKFSDLYNKKEPLYNLYKSLLIKLLLIGFPIFALIFFIAPDMFALIFGEKWRITGEYSRILIPYLFMNFIIAPFSFIPMVLGYQKEIFLISLAGNLIFLSIFFIFKSYKFKIVLLISSLFMFCYFLFVLFYFRRILKDGV